MKWILLKQNKCPNCEKDFIYGLKTIPVKDKGQLLAHKCGFKIYERRYSEIINSQVIAGLEARWDKEQII